MFVAVILEKSKKNLVIPVEWIDSIHPSELINEGINASTIHVIFYSPKKEEANFALPLKEKFDNDVRACYLGRVRRFFDFKPDAETYSGKRRSVLPVSYNSKRTNKTVLLNMNRDANIEENPMPREPSIEEDSKAKLNEEITRRMNLMNNLECIDLCDSEIDEIQDILQAESDEEDEFDDADDFFKFDDDDDEGLMPLPLFIKTQPLEVNNENIADFDVMAVEPYHLQPHILTAVLNNQPSENANERYKLPRSHATDVFDVNEVNGSNEATAEINSFNQIQNSSEIEHDYNEMAGEHHVYLEPQVSNAASNEKAQQNSDEDSQKYVQQAELMLEVMHLHVPDKYSCIFENKKFCFPSINVSVKLSIMKMIITWNTTSPFSSILFDGKFVELLLVEIIGKTNLGNNALDNNKMKFIKDLFIIRAKGEPNRLIKFSDYVQKKKEQVKKRQQRTSI